MKRFLTLFLTVLLLCSSILVSRIVRAEDEDDFAVSSETQETSGDVEERQEDSSSEDADVISENSESDDETEESEDLDVLPPQDEEKGEIQSVSPSGTYAYAMLSNNGDFVLFRSSDVYTDGSTKTLTISGKSYTGTVYADIETLDFTWGTAPWDSKLSSIKKVYVASGHVVKPISTGRWFSYCSNLISADLTGLNLSNVTNTSSMFSSCSSLKTITFGDYDTKNLTDMNWMFCGCSSLVTLDLSHFNTSKVTNMSNLFSDCSSLTSVNIKNFNTSKVYNMSNMFEGCSSLLSIDVSSFDTSNVTDMFEMFDGCHSLTSLDLSNFVTSKVWTMKNMFRGCYDLEALDISGFDTSLIEEDEMSGMFGLSSCFSTIYLSKHFTKWIDDAYLPSGTWKHGSLEKTEVELYNQYPSHASEWAGKWTLNTEEREDFESGFKLGRDNNSFKHEFDEMFTGDSFTFDKNFWDVIQRINGDVETNKILKTTKKKTLFNYLSDPEGKYWGGSCYGISMTMAMVYNNLYRASDLSDLNPSNYYGLKPVYDAWIGKRDDKLLQNYIQYYFYSQNFEAPYHSARLVKKNGIYCYEGVLFDDHHLFKNDDSFSSYDGCYSDLNEALKGLVDYIYENRRVSVFTYGFHHTTATGKTMSGAHAVLVTGIRINSLTKEYEIQLYDMNYRNRFFTLYVAADFSYYYFEGVSGAGNANGHLKFFYILSPDKIRKLARDTEQYLSEASSSKSSASINSLKDFHDDSDDEEQNDSAYIEYDMSSSFVLTLDDGRNLVYEDCEFSGDIEVLSRSVPLYGSEEQEYISYETIEIENFPSISVTPLLGTVDITVFNSKGLVSIEGSNIDSAELSFDDGVTIEGTDYDFESYITADIYSGDELVMNSLSGHSSGTTHIHEQDGVIVADNEQGIIPQEANTYIGVNAYTTEYDESDEDVQIILDDHQYSADEYIVSFKSDIEGYEVPDQYLSEGEHVNKPEDLEGVEGLVFNGWYTSGVFQNEDTLWDFDNDTVDENVVLYAAYEVIDNSDLYGDILPEDRPADPSDIPESPWYSLNASESEYYTGKAIKKSFRVYDHKTLLKEGKDYTVKYSNNTKVSTETSKATITITGKGNYTRKETITFDILRKPLGDDDVSLTIPNLKYNGKVQYSKPVLKFNGKTLKLDTDYTLEYNEDYEGAYRDVGDYTFVIDGRGSYQGHMVCQFSITDDTAWDISKMTLTKLKNVTYTGEPIDPDTFDVVLKDPKTKQQLVKGIHYLLSLSEDTVNVGTVTVNIWGIQSCYGSRKTSFKITGIPMSKTKVSGLSSSFIYDGQEKLQEFLVVTYQKDKKSEIKTLTPGEDYELSYVNNVRAGTATVTLTGKGLYTGTNKKTFKITPYDLSKQEEGRIRVDYESYAPYRKTGAKPEVTVYDGEKLLTEGTDYTVVCKNNKKIDFSFDPKKGPTFTIKGKGSYKGSTASCSFAIYERYLNDPDISISANDRVYTTKKNGWKSAPTLKDSGKKLAAGTDYDKNDILYTYILDTLVNNGTVQRYSGDIVQPTDIIPAGTYIQVTVNGIKNYYGQRSTVYRITAADISKANVTVKAKSYTGKPVTLDPEDITVKLNKQVIDPSNYYVDETSYKNNVNKGKASVTIKGISNLGSSKTVNFSIGAKLFQWWFNLWQ